MASPEILQHKLRILQLASEGEQQPQSPTTAPEASESAADQTNATAEDNHDDPDTVSDDLVTIPSQPYYDKRGRGSETLAPDNVLLPGEPGYDGKAQDPQGPYRNPTESGAESSGRKPRSRRVVKGLGYLTLFAVPFGLVGTGMWWFTGNESNPVKTTVNMVPYINPNHQSVTELPTEPSDFNEADNTQGEQE